MSDTARARRLGFAVVPLAAVALIVPGVAMAAASSTPAASNTMAGCLKAGTLTNVAVAAKPAKKCKTGYTKVVWNVKGAKGATGATGPKGAKGDSGLQGIAGAAGAVGAVGPKGDKGDKGDTGLQGLTGLTGLTGLQGLTGAAGAAGADGADGVSGYQVVKNVVPAGNPLGLGGIGNPVSVACPSGKSVLSGGVIPSAASVTGLTSVLNPVLGGLLGVSAGAILNQVTSAVSVAPLPSGDALSIVTPLLANVGDTFYAVCVTATSAAG